MCKEDKIEDGRLSSCHKSLLKGYILDVEEDLEFIEERYGILMHLDYSVQRDPTVNSDWICPDCGTHIKKSYVNIVKTGLSCECGMGSDEGITERQWVARKFKCLECDERHTFAILCGYHYAQEHRSDPNIIAHEYRRETRRMVLNSGWKPQAKYFSLLYPCHICGQDNTAVKMTKSHWEWHHSKDVDLTTYKEDFFRSLGLAPKKCTWCKKPTEILAVRTGFATVHPECKYEHKRNSLRRAVGIRNEHGEPIDEDNNVIPELDVRYPND